MGYLGQSCFCPELFQFVDLFSLNRKRGKQKPTSFRVRILKFISKTKKSTAQSVIQFRTCFFSKFLKVIGFCDFFSGEGESDDVIVSDRLASENFSNPAFDPSRHD